MADTVTTTQEGGSEAAKKWYQSSGVWGGLGAMLTSVLGVVVSMWPDLVTAEDAANLAANVPAAVMAMASVIGSVVAIVGRIRAKKAIGK